MRNVLFLLDCHSLFIETEVLFSQRKLSSLNCDHHGLAVLSKSGRVFLLFVSAEVFEVADDLCVVLFEFLTAGLLVQNNVSDLLLDWGLERPSCHQFNLCLFLVFGEIES